MRFDLSQEHRPPGLRGWLRLVPLLALGARVVPAAADPKSPPAENQAEPAVKLMSEIFGVPVQSVSIQKNVTNAAAVQQKSQRSALARSLLDRLSKAGLQAGSTEAEKVEFAFSGTAAKQKKPTLDVAKTALLKDQRKVGSLYHVAGPSGEVVFSLTTLPNGNLEWNYYDKGKFERTVFDHAKGTVVTSTAADERLPQGGGISPKKVSCTDVCNVACNAGWGARIPACIVGCVESGPAEPVCAAMCAGISGGLCLFGCDNIC